VVANAAFGRHDPVYHMPKNVGVRERVTCGDSFYLEALMRFKTGTAEYSY
jgi:hypothetical protein